MTTTCSMSFKKFFHLINNSSLCYTRGLLLLQHRSSSSVGATKTKPQRKGKDKPASSETDLKDNFPFQNLSDFHNSSRRENEDEQIHVDGLAVSKNGKSLLFPLAKHQQNLSKCIPKSDSTSASVTKILKETMPPERMLILKRWENKMIRELGVEGFQSYKQEIFSTGHEFHQYVQDYLPSGKPPDAIPDRLIGYWSSINQVFQDVTDVKVLETSVKHPYLNYHGIVDCVACWRNQLCVIDWKTSRKKKSTLKDTYDNPLQAAAYAGAINFSEETQHQITNVAIIIAYEDGAQADVHFLDTDATKFYWTRWLERLQEYKETIRPSSHSSKI